MAVQEVTKPIVKDESFQIHNNKMDSIITKLQGIIDALGLDPTIYKPAGTKTCAELVHSLLITGNLGDVYNITDSGTTTADFVEGAGKPINAGANVAIVDIGTGGTSVYKFDLLSGIVDLSNYVQKSQTQGLLKNDGTVDTNDYAEKVTGATNGNLAGLNGSGNLTDSGWNGAKDTTSISGNPISISGLKANQLAINPIITFEPIQAGSGTPSPSNIRAISGYDKVEVGSCGKNLVNIYANVKEPSDTAIANTTKRIFEPNTLVKGLAFNNYYRSDQVSNISAINETLSGYSSNIYGVGYAVKLKNVEYTVSWSTKTGNLHILKYAKDGTFMGSSELSTSPTTITMPSNTDMTVILIVGSDSSFSISNLQVEENTTSTTYSPYHKTTDISESLGQTVYGATWYLRTGKLLGEWTLIDLSTLSWGYSSSSKRYEAPLPNAKNVGTGRSAEVICEKYATDTGAAVGDSYKVFVSSTNIYVYDASQGGNPTGNCAYKLATPIEIQLTPHEISLLKDYAYVSTNGTSIALDYHNGELASLADVAQLGETVNELGKYVDVNEANDYSFKKVFTPASGSTVFKLKITPVGSTNNTVEGIIFSRYNICSFAIMMNSNNKVLVANINTLTHVQSGASSVDLTINVDSSGDFAIITGNSIYDTWLIEGYSRSGKDYFKAEPVV